jgi:Family of unknown function (DUF6166)
MSGDGVTYVGLCSRQLSFGAGDNRVVGVVEGDTQRPLPPPDPRWAQIPSWSRAGPFEWGYEGALPLQIAESILLHHLGFQPAGIVALAFSREVISRLPDDFELHARRVDEWISEHLVSGCLPRPAGNGRQPEAGYTSSRVPAAV